MGGAKQVNAVIQQVKNPFEVFAHTNGPGEWSTLDLKDVLDFIQQIDGITSLPIQLVNEGNNRGIAQPAHFHQLDGACLHTLGTVNDHQRGIDSGQSTVGIFREVLMTRSIQQVNHVIPIGELHHR